MDKSTAIPADVGNYTKEIAILFALFVGPGLFASVAVEDLFSSLTPLLAIITHNGAFSLLILYLTDLRGERHMVWHGERSPQGISGRVISICIVAGALFTTAFLLAFVYSTMGIEAHATETVPPLRALSQTASPFVWIPLFVGTMFSIGFVEELFFRGYLLRRFRQLNLSPSLSVVLSGLLFSVGHRYQGMIALVFSFAAGVILAVLWRKRGGLLPFAMGHALYNAMVLALRGL